MSPIIIGVTGLPSSGKGLFCEIANKFGFKALIMGDVIRNECLARGLPVNRESSNFVMVQLREELGANAVAVKTLKWVKQAITDGHQLILIDGIRSWAEVETFENEIDNFMVIAIHASPKQRFERAMLRKRIDDAFSRQDFDQRDTIELSVGIGEVIAKANILVDTNQDLKHTKELFTEIIKEILSQLEISLNR